MSPTTAITSSISTFVNALLGIALSIFHAISGVLQAVLNLIQSTIQLGLDLCQGVVGFVTANFLVIAVLGGIYYAYTQKQGRRTGVKSR
jgi:phage-related protein